MLKSSKYGLSAAGSYLIDAGLGVTQKLTEVVPDIKFYHIIPECIFMSGHPQIQCSHI